VQKPAGCLPLLNVQPLTGANATKTAVLKRLEQASLIHLATHGMLDSERGIDSAIALAPMNVR
jgi:CHAT domain-containing protein